MSVIHETELENAGSSNKTITPCSALSRALSREEEKTIKSGIP